MKNYNLTTSFRWKKEKDGSFTFLEGGETYGGVRVFLENNRWKVSAYHGTRSWGTAEEAIRRYENFYRNALNLQKERNGG